MTTQPVLIKIGGHEIGDHDFLTELADVVRELHTPVIIVHGGGKEISDLQQKLGIEPRYIDGVRITDAESLTVVEMVLCGTVNKRLVRYLVNGGVDAIGKSGIDRGLIRARQMPHPTIDMGFTGEVTSVRGDVLRQMLEQGLTPVIAPICLAEDGTSGLNVNADHVAGAVAAASEVSRIVFITNVEGVLIADEPVPCLTPAQVDTLISEGTISGGMIPKVKTAMQALESGVPQAVITNLHGLRTHGGTIFTHHTKLGEE